MCQVVSSVWNLFLGVLETTFKSFASRVVDLWKGKPLRINLVLVSQTINEESNLSTLVGNLNL